MKQTNILYLLMGGVMMIMTSCSQSANNNQSSALADDRPPLEHTDADRTFGVLLEISSDSLMTCSNNFSGQDSKPLILDTTSPAFPDILSNWFASMDSIQMNRLKNGSELHISVGDGVTEASVEKVKRNVIKCGIEGLSISNF